ncbi:MAG: AMP-binding protein [Bacteroidales bacterium]|nr:AMP-binding protein [Bacteroidales bacterium]
MKKQNSGLTGLFSGAMQENWHRSAFSDFGGDTFSFRDVAGRIHFLHQLFKESKIAGGDKVALLGTNSSDWSISFLAILSYGAVVVPILPDFSTENIHHIINHSGSKLLLVSGSIFERIDPEHMKNVHGMIDLKNFGLLYDRNDKLKKALEKAESYYKTLNIKPKDIIFKDGGSEDLAVISYTSGTSGFTKGVMLPRRSLFSNIIFAREHMPLNPGDSIVSFLPLAHVFGLLFEFLFPFVQGCHITFLTKVPSPAVVTKAFGEIRPHLILSVPLVIEKIYRKRILPKIDKPITKILLKTPVLSTIIEKKVNKALTETFGERFMEIVIGGAPLSEDVEVFFRKIGFRFTIGYGMTECGPLITYEGWKKCRFRSAGKVVDRMKIKIEKEKPDSEIGEILVKGENLMLGYYNNEEATKEVFTDDGWLKTGDLGYLDSDGYLYIKGRSKNMLLGPSGQNIYPEELEAKISGMPCVQECVVKQHNDKLVAMIYPDREAMECNNQDFQDIDKKMKEMLKELNKGLPRYEQITDIEIVDEEFVKTPKKNIKRYLYT